MISEAPAKWRHKFIASQEALFFSARFANREVAQFQMQKANASLKTTPMKLCESLIQIISQNYRSAQTTASTVGGQMNCKCTLQFLT